MATLIANRGIQVDKISWVPNWADESAFRPTPRDPALSARLGPSRRFTAMYAGNLGEMQALETVVEAAALLRNRTDIGFALVGAGVVAERLRAQVAELGLDNVQFLPPQPFDRMAQVLALGDTQLVTLKDAPLFASTLPSKLQANLAAGKPVVGAVRGDAAGVIRAAKAGDVTTPEDPRELAEAVVRQASLSPDELNAMGRRARAYYEANFSERVVGDRLTDLLETAARTRRE
jgi:glycosyltransferase involved in cell wall biosynthesis